MNEAVHVSVLLALRWYTDFFRSADIFERFKCVVQLEPWTIKLTPTKPGVKIENVLSDLINALQTDGETWPVAVWTDSPRYLWRDSVIKSISTGAQWTTLNDYLDFFAGTHDWPKLEITTKKDGGFRWDHK